MSTQASTHFTSSTHRGGKAMVESVDDAEYGGDEDDDDDDAATMSLRRIECLYHSFFW